MASKVMKGKKKTVLQVQLVQLGLNLITKSVGCLSMLAFSKGIFHSIILLNANQIYCTCKL